MLYQQPIGGPVTPDLSGEFLSGGTVQALLIGTGFRYNVADRKPTVISGSVIPYPAQGGQAALSLGVAGDLSCTTEAVGGSIYFDFWHGIYYGGGNTPANAYIFGDYNGSAGTGLAAKHSGIGYRWGWFNGGTLEDSGEELAAGTLQTFVITRDTINGSQKIYRNGKLIFTSVASSVAMQANFTVGSVGRNQYPTFGCESSVLLAGRVRFRSLSENQVKRFSENPWQILLDPDEDEEALLAAVAKTKRALTLTSGNLSEVTDAQVGTGKKFAVLVGGVIQQRVTSEGLPIVIAQGQLRTLASDETLII